MGLKLRIQWFDKLTELGEGGERSSDLGEDHSIIESLGLPTKNTINNGCFNVPNEWTPVLQPYFKHSINLEKYDYTIAFDHSDKWR